MSIGTTNEKPTEADEDEELPWDCPWDLFGYWHCTMDCQQCVEQFEKEMAEENGENEDQEEEPIYDD